MKAFVNTQDKGKLNLRAKPSLTASILAQIPFGESVEVEKTQDEWAFITYHTTQGYVMNKFLSTSSKTITKEDLQTIYKSLKETLATIEKIIK